MNGSLRFPDVLPILAGLLAIPILAAAALGAAEPVVATGQADRQLVNVTVYNSDIALVREVRSVELPAGDFRLEFRDVPARINPVTLLVEAAGKSGLRLLEQNYEFDLMSREKILQKYVGRSIAWLQENGERIDGRLLGMAQGPVYEVGGEILFEVPGRLVLPSLPENLRAVPTLVWEAHTAKAAREEIETTYLTGGFSWHADYVLQLDPAGSEAELQAWVTVENRTGASFENADLLLVAGELNRVRAPGPDKMYAMAAEAGGRSVSDFVEETLYDYHLYTLQRPTTLLDQQIKQISLFEANGVQVQKKYRLQAAPRIFRGGHFDSAGKVEVRYRLHNAKDNNLGLPLPAGVFRVYGRSEAGARQLLGEDRIDHTPRDETVELTVGKAFDIAAERVRTDSRRLGENAYRTSFRITLRNHRDQDVVVEVLESVGGFWEVTTASHEYRKISDRELAFDVAVPAAGQSELTYTVDVRN